MKLSCLQENLKQGLNIVSHIAAKTTSLPILNNVLFQVDEGTLKLMSTNLEVGISCLVRAKIEKKGSYTINSKLINDYVNLLPNETVEMKLEDDFFKIKCSNYETKIKGNNADEFPLIPQLKKEGGYACKSDDLFKALTQTMFAVSVSESRPEICGLYFNFNGDNLTMAATDSYRLAERSIKLTEKVEGEKELIVPAKTINELVRILGAMKRNSEEGAGDSDMAVNFYIEDNQILFAFDNIELVSRIIEGQYPNYKQIIPTNYRTKAVINISELAQAVKTASLFSRVGIFDVNLEILSDKVIVTSSNNQLGDNKVEVNATVEGDKNQIVVNYRYLLDGLANVDATDVILEMTDSANPCLLKPAESLDGGSPISLENYLYIIMPIKQ